MIPIVTPEEMAAVDEVALRVEPLEAIVDRVGRALAREALEMLGGTYGRRVLAVAGPGLNGADARSCASHLARRGVRVEVLDIADLPDELRAVDLVIDGAFGTGLSRPWNSPKVAAQVLAVDIPSGIDGLTGEALGRPLRATNTLTLAALKPGLLLGDGPEYAGRVSVADIGLDVSGATTHLVEDDVAGWLPSRDRSAHKWQSAVLVVAGSPGMTGAAHLVSRAALRTGAGYVHLDTAVTADPGLPIEVVSSLGGKGPAPNRERFSAAVVGPGLGRSSSAAQLVRAVVGSLDIPLVIDGDGISAIAGAKDLLADSPAQVVITPHDGEFEILTGARPGPDRIAAAKACAETRSAIVLLKGPVTVIAHPDGRVRVSNTGDARLATAGSGDVLSGIIAAFMAQGVPAFEAAAAGAFVHGKAAALGHVRGLIASDLPDQIPTALNALA